MLRRKLAGTAALALALVMVAGCGSSDATPSPSAEEPASSAPAATQAPATEAPSATPGAPSPAGNQKLLAICAGVAIRKGPTTGDDLLVRVTKLTKVRVVATVPGDSYEAGACGTSGSDWLQIDRINGKSVKKLYGVKYGYAAAGFFQ
jgi:hypothetical protein